MSSRNDPSWVICVHRLAFLAFVILFASLDAACGDDGPQAIPDPEVCLERRDGARYCIELYESARADATESSAGSDEASPPRAVAGLIPWTSITWAGAKVACESKSKRLCERDEWIDACDGAVGEDEGNTYTYGNDRDPGICNTDGGGVETTGNRPGCKSLDGTFDQSGNVWEWTGNSMAAGAARGGNWESSQLHECKSGDSNLFIPLDEKRPTVGFRCCRNAS